MQGLLVLVRNARIKQGLNKVSESTYREPSFHARRDDSEDGCQLCLDFNF